MTPRLSLVIVLGLAVLALAPLAQAQQPAVRAESGGVAIGGRVSGSTITIGFTLEQYEAGLKKRAEEIRAEEAEKRVQLQKLVELTERATSAEKDKLLSQIAAAEADKRRLEAESKGVADRLANLQASYDGLVQKLAEANAALEAFAPLISKESFDQAQAMLRRGDLLGAERKFVEIANTVAKIRAKADVVEANASFQAGELAEQRIDWRAAYAHYARAVAAYRGALKEFTRERAPLQWAAIQIKLGTALLILGERESGTDKLNEAVVVFHKALKEYTRARAARLGRNPD